MLKAATVLYHTVGINLEEAHTRTDQTPERADREEDMSGSVSRFVSTKSDVTKSKRIQGDSSGRCFLVSHLYRRRIGCVNGAPMDGISLAQLSRIMLHGIALVLGSLGVVAASAPTSRNMRFSAWVPQRYNYGFG